MKALIGKLHGDLIFSRRTRVLAEALAGLLPRNATVLDVGCGDGTIAGLCRTIRPDIHIEGIDVLVRPSTVIPVSAFDGQVLPFPDRSWDVVTFIDVLHHTENPGQLLREASRVARQYVIIKDHLSQNSIDRLSLSLMDWIGNAPHGVVLTYNYQSLKQWKTLFSNAKLIVDTETVDVPLYVFPLNVIFGRKLHVVTRLRPDSPG
ncbi:MULTISPECIES: class I SAM-dependent methyltransferase [unclassified Methylobacterium]|uniref:class I SAM-dependent methyltransferase n=1 Tax=unclassified Methylobacterium TaxID=2615210 RepID=UPI0013528C1F|nr:class I SAM-dependent methyltransferase [Methylobacterium sp. 2A]MWV20845.1 class I SAM-dependent methyltransferase [Methylobacterium sp. 2A]